MTTSVYVLAASRLSALRQYSKGDWYETHADADADLKQFGRSYQRVFRLDFEVSEIEA